MPAPTEEPAFAHFRTLKNVPQARCHCALPLGDISTTDIDAVLQRSAVGAHTFGVASRPGPVQ